MSTLDKKVYQIVHQWEMSSGSSIFVAERITHEDSEHIYDQYALQITLNIS